MLSDLVQNHGMIISGAILLIAYIFIATEKIQKSWTLICVKKCNKRVQKN